MSLLSTLIQEILPSWGRPTRRCSTARLKCCGGESLESRQLPTTDLALGPLAILGATLSDNGSGQPIVSMTVSVEIENEGTTPIDLSNGTPDDFSDDVMIAFAPSADAVFDVGDTPFVNQSAALAFPGNMIIAPGTHKTFAVNGSFFQNVPIAGIVGKVDVTNVVAEDDETNNTTVAYTGIPIVTTSPDPQPVLRRKLNAIDPGAGVYDGNSANFSDGRIFVKIDSPQSGDRLRLIANGSGPDRMKVSGINLMLGKKVIGTVLGNKTDNLTIHLDPTQNVGLLTVQRIMRNVGFQGTITTPRTRSIHFQVRDPNSNISDIVSKTVQFA